MSVFRSVGVRPAVDWPLLFRNLIVAQTVSFVALSLGAAFGILSGRGAFAGMLSAGLFAAVAAGLGGTRVQCSGPTAPMTAVVAGMMALTSAELVLPAGTSLDQFVNLTLFLTAFLLIVGGLFRFARFIRLVPNVVVSGFMDGIALLIWIDQAERLFGIFGKSPLSGALYLNLFLALGTLVAIFLLPPLLFRLSPTLARVMPGTLLAIVLFSLLANLLEMPVEHVTVGTGASTLSDLLVLAKAQWPTDWSVGTLWLALPYVLQLAMLCYLDTLLTVLVVDKLSGESSDKNRELVGQGAATAAVAVFGGIPGAQATIRSVLMLREKASMRLAGIMVGVFVLIEVVLLLDFIRLIPQAVFTGVLFKVGYDVLDRRPLALYWDELRVLGREMFRTPCDRRDQWPIFVTTRELLMIAGTAAVTVVFSLNAAVLGFTVLFWLHNRVFNRRNPMRDLRLATETRSPLGEV